MRRNDCTFQEIADYFGISRQRAHQILHGSSKKGRWVGGYEPLPSGRPMKDLDNKDLTSD